MLPGVPAGNFTKTSCCPVIFLRSLLNVFQSMVPVALTGIVAINLPFLRSSNHTSSIPLRFEEATTCTEEGGTRPNSTPDIINHPPYFDVLVTARADP